jgi:hypothetical protein
MSDQAFEELSQWCQEHDVELLDFRDLKQWPREKSYPPAIYGYPADKSRAQPRGSRTWEQLTCLMLHTTAVSGLGKNRGIGLPCHFFVPKEPALVLCHELERILAHGHAANRFSACVEISGTSGWEHESQLPRVQALLRYFKAKRLARIGSDAPYYVMAHRQSHSSRANDPGRQIWQDAGEWAIRELGYQLGPTVGTGRGVDEWRR